jgi:2-dehydro-3-deoxyphosphogluconate aldolase/(4S)-4-hydroxy-2-oxoglutarate aldolase
VSPTEILRARALGARTVKVFPAAPLGGPAYIRVLRGPFPDVPLVPTGGIEITEVGSYLEAGAAAVALGASLVGREPPASDEDLEALRRRAAAAAEAARAT